jgi:hypothetical protein
MPFVIEVVMDLRLRLLANAMLRKVPGKPGRVDGDGC